MNTEQGKDNGVEAGVDATVLREARSGTGNDRGCDCSPQYKEKHNYLDFLYFKLLTSVPLFTVLVGFWHSQPWMILAYVAWIALHMTLVYRLLCTHCPHYGVNKGKTECHYLWAVPAIFKARPGPQNFFEKLGVKALLGVSILFPVYWLARNWELLVIYLLSVAVLLITMMRYECTRCIHFDCSHNRAVRPVEGDGEAGVEAEPSDAEG